MANPTVPKIKFPWRTTIYGIVILYLGADLYVFRGPLSKMLERMNGRGIEDQIAKVPTGLVATVNTWPITVSDLERGVWEYCAVRGLEVSQVPDGRLQVIRTIVLDKLINDLAIWHFSRLNPVEVDPAEVDAAIAELRGHFKDGTSFSERIAAQGMDEAEFRSYITDQVHQRKWLQAKAQKSISVSDEEVQAWFTANPEETIVPERWRARQIFMATLDKDPAEVSRQIRSVAAAVKAGELTFAQAVEQHSEDGRSKQVAGDLNYFSAARLPEDFIAAIARLEPGEVGDPFQTTLGWHLVELTDHQAERPANIAELREEIRAHLSSLKRENVMEQIVKDLRKRSKIWPPKPQPRAILNPEEL